jgi:hypothetical protein
MKGANMKKAYLIALAMGLVATGGGACFGQMQSAEPGPIHKQLAKRAGEYTTVTRFLPAPGAPAVESKGSAKLTAIIDGRFLLEEANGIFMGQPTKGTRIWGFDNATKQYESAWMYSGSTGIMRLTGSSNDGGKTINFVASFNDENGAKQTFDAALRLVDDDQFVVGLYARGADGSRGPTFDTTYTRKKK